MKLPRDLTVGERLSAGFAVAALILVALVAFSLGQLGEIARLRRRQAVVIVPRAEAADRLETAVLYLGLAARTHVILPDTARGEAVQRALGSAREELARLDALPKDPDGAAIWIDVPRLFAAYAGEVTRLEEAVSRGASAEALHELEADLTRSREELLGPVRAFAALQSAKTASAREEIGGAQARLERALVTLGMLLLVLLALAAALTAHSVRRPVQTLVDATRRLAAGDWGPALALDPAAATATPRNELAELAQGVGRMARALRDREERLQAQNEELQAQQEELQSQNEELQAQQEQIQAQNEELHSQQEELESQNEELHRRQKDLHEQGDELRRTVDELRQRDRELKAADARKTEFLALLSHELRNPLAPIRNGLFVLERAAPGSDQAVRAQRVVERQVGHLARLVDDLLDITRIGSGKVQLQRDRVDLAALVRQTAEDNEALLRSHGVALEVDVGPGPAHVHGDPARLAQVIGNLLQNAAKFTPRGGSVELRLDATGDGHAVVRVRDDGVGIAPEVLPHVFEPFVQADASLDRARGGLGLGLALVRGMIELHGGSVRAHSDGPGKGAEFVFELPLDGRVEERPAPEPRPVPSARRVLVVEDNVDAADSLREALELVGHEVRVAYDGSRGLDAAREWRPDVVLCDIGLPDIDGYAVARAIRTDPTLGAVLLVALTGYALPEDRRRASEAGFDHHLSKPPSLEQLEELLASKAASGAGTQRAG